MTVAEATQIRCLIAEIAVSDIPARIPRFNPVSLALKAHTAEIARLLCLYLRQRFEPSPLYRIGLKAKGGEKIEVVPWSLSLFVDHSQLFQQWHNLLPETDRVFVI